MFSERIYSSFLALFPASSPLFYETGLYSQRTGLRVLSSGGFFEPGTSGAVGEYSCLVPLTSTRLELRQ